MREREMGRVWKREIDGGVSGWEKDGDYKREREREGGEWGRDIEKDEESMRIGKERKSQWKTDVPKLYAYNEYKHSV